MFYGVLIYPIWKLGVWDLGEFLLIYEFGYGEHELRKLDTKRHEGRDGRMGKPIYGVHKATIYMRSRLGGFVYNFFILHIFFCPGLEAQWGFQRSEDMISYYLVRRSQLLFSIPGGGKVSRGGYLLRRGFELSHTYVIYIIYVL